MPDPMTPEQRLALIERIESQDAARRRRAIGTTWLSVAAAAVVLGLVVFGARRELMRTQRDLRDARAARERIEADIGTLRTAQAAAQAQLEATEAKLSASLGALGRVGDAQRQAAVEQQIAAEPDTARLLPRVYLQIVDADDRAFAVQMGRRLERAGMIALGVEYVPRAARLKTTDVRYYKAADEPGAVRIVEVLKGAGVEARLNFLNMEDNTRVRQNHFEVWFAAGARRTPSP
ncbi:MAG: hypothetical protein AB7O28_05780 [Vicinamibacterales bacterium]